MDIRRIAFVLAGAALFAAVALPVAHDGRAAAQGPDDAVLARGKVDHVIVIVMENRTFDNVFGGDGIAGHPSPYPSANALVPPSIVPLMTIAAFKPQPAPGPNNWHDTFECVASGGFTNAAWQANASPNSCSGFNFTPPNGPFYYLDVADRAVYWNIAQQYELGDAFFAPGSTDSYPGHQFIVAGRSSDADGDEIADQPFYGNTSYHAGYTTGCADVLGAASPGPTPSILVPAIGPTSSPWVVPVTRGFDGECYQAATFADRLVQRSYEKIAPAFTWQHYATVTTIPAPYSGEQPFNGFINSATWWNHPWPQATQVLGDAKTSALPTFAWVKPPCVPASDHPGTGNGGPSWVEDVVNAIGNSPNWNSTVIFVIWDDWGGFYDHATPPPTRTNDDLGPGLRTPFLVISPFVVPGNVTHGTGDYGSILRFVEQLYGIRPLGDIDAESPDFRGAFDFSTTRPFVTVTAAPSITWSDACKAGEHQDWSHFRD
jgi:phospholipase C